MDLWQTPENAPDFVTYYRTPSKHGTNNRYSKGCRCDECRVAHRIYERERTRNIRRARQGLESRHIRLVDATEAREHIEFLRSRGIGLLAIGEHCGLHKSYIRDVARGRKQQIMRKNHNKIIAVPALYTMGGQYQNANEAKRLLKEMRDAGFMWRQIADAMGQKSASINIRVKVRTKRLHSIRSAHAKLMKNRPS